MQPEMVRLDRNGCSIPSCHCLVPSTSSDSDPENDCLELNREIKAFSSSISRTILRKVHTIAFTELQTSYYMCL